MYYAYISTVALKLNFILENCSNLNTNLFGVIFSRIPYVVHMSKIFFK